MQATSLRVKLPGTPRAGIKRRLSGDLVPLGLPSSAKSILHQAVHDGDLSAVQRLTAADPTLINAADELEGVTALMTASISVNPKAVIEVTKALLEAGASLTLKDKKGNTALHWACELVCSTPGAHACFSDHFGNSISSFSPIFGYQAHHITRMFLLKTP